MKHSKYIKCRFCDWKILRFRTNKKGWKISNYLQLQEHCIIHHEDELKKHNLLMYEKIDFGELK